MADETLQFLIKAQNDTGPALASVKQGIEGAGQAATGAHGPLGTLGDKVSGLASNASSSVGGLGGLTSGLGGAALAATGLGGIMAGGLALGGMVDKAEALAKSTGSLQKVIGGTAEDASRLLFVFKETGVDSDTATGSLKKLEKGLEGLQENEDGTTTKSSAVVDKLKALGITTEDATGKTLPMNDVMKQLADKFKDMPNGTEKSALAMQLFGKSGTDMIPVLNKGAEGISELEKESDKFGLTMSGKTVASVKEMTAEHRKMDAAMDGLQVQIGTLLIPAMTKLAAVGMEVAVFINEKLVPAIRDWNAWFTEHIQPTLQKFSDWISGTLLPTAQTVFTGITTAIQGVVDWVTANWAQISDLLQGPFDIAKAAITGIVTEIKDSIRIGLDLITGVFDIWKDIFNGDWSKAWEDIKTLVGRLLGDIKTLIGDQLTAIIGIADGVWTTLQTAAGLAWEGLKTLIIGALSELVGWITSNWKDIALTLLIGPFWLFRDQIGGVLATAVATVSALPGQITAALGNLGGLLVQAGRDLVQGLINGITSMFGPLQDAANALGNIPGKILSLFGRSPWPGMVPHGQDAGQGFIDGLNEKAPSVAAAATGLAASFKAAMAAAVPELVVAASSAAATTALGFAASFKAAMAAATPDAVAATTPPGQAAGRNFAESFRAAMASAGPVIVEAAATVATMAGHGFADSFNRAMHAPAPLDHSLAGSFNRAMAPYHAATAAQQTAAHLAASNAVAASIQASIPVQPAGPPRQLTQFFTPASAPVAPPAHLAPAPSGLGSSTGLGAGVVINISTLDASGMAGAMPELARQLDLYLRHLGQKGLVA